MFDPLGFLAEVSAHVPDPHEKTTIFYGWSRPLPFVFPAFLPPGSAVASPGRLASPGVRPQAFSKFLSGSYRVLAPHSVAKAVGFG